MLGWTCVFRDARAILPRLPRLPRSPLRCPIRRAPPPRSLPKQLCCLARKASTLNQCFVKTLKKKKLAGEKRRKANANALKKRTQRIFTPVPPPLPSEPLQVDLLDVPATELALVMAGKKKSDEVFSLLTFVFFPKELTRLSLSLFRDAPTDKLVAGKLEGSLAALRSRTARLSLWTASVVVVRQKPLFNSLLFVSSFYKGGGCAKTSNGSVCQNGCGCSSVGGFAQHA
jgi:hypothetical protein